MGAVDGKSVLPALTLPRVAPPPPDQPDSPVATGYKMFALKAVMLDVDMALEYNATTRCKLFHKLLSEHKALTDEHGRLKTELDKTAKAQSQAEELLRTLLPLENALKLAKAAHKDCVQASTYNLRMKECEEAHQAALQKERDELSRVKLELEKLQKEKAEAETALAEEIRLRVEETKQLQDKLDEDVERSNSVEKQLDELKEKPAQCYLN